MEATEERIVQQLREGNEEAYAYLFGHHYAVLCHIATNYVHDDFLAETIVGDVIFHLWEIRQTLNIQTSLRSYLMKSVRHRCLDYLKSQYARHEERISQLGADILPTANYLHNDDYPLGRLLDQELEQKIAQAINRLPETCRQVFTMSRFDGKKNEEIARELSISVNTVKYHISHALALLHQDLRNYLISAIMAFISLGNIS